MLSKHWNTIGTALERKQQYERANQNTAPHIPHARSISSSCEETEANRLHHEPKYRAIDNRGRQCKQN